MKKYLSLVSLILAVVASVSCSSDIDDIDTKPALESITNSDIVAMPNAQSLRIEYQSNAKCRVEIDEEATSWISCGSIDDSADCVVLNIEKNVDGATRYSFVRIVLEDDPDTFIQYSITQYADDSSKIYYTTTDGEIFVPEYEDKFTNGFGAAIKSHSYEQIGVIEFYGDVSTIGNFQERYPMSHRLKSIYLPEGLSSISDYAFFECKELEDVWLPETLQSIGTEAFYRCNKLSTIAIPNSVTEVNSRVFC